MTHEIWSLNPEMFPISINKTNKHIDVNVNVIELLCWLLRVYVRTLYMPAKHVFGEISVFPKRVI